MTHRSLSSLMSIILGIIVLSPPSFAITIPQSMNYQGRLTNTGGAPLSGSYSLTFTVYDDSTSTNPGNIKWQEVHPSVTVTNGLFNVLLGVGNPKVPLTAAVFAGEPRFLDIRIGGSPTSGQPRIRIVSTAYAFTAQNADTAEIARKAQKLSLPFSDTAQSSGSSFTIANTGGGGAGIFRIDNASSAAPALRAITNGTREAVFGRTTGCYPAGQFQIDNAGCSHAALVGFTNGSGSGVYGWTSGAGSAVKGWTSGTWFAGEFAIDNPASNSICLSSYSNGSGACFFSRTVGTGTAGDIRIDNPVNGSAALYVSTNGFGPAALLLGGNVGVRTTDPTSSLDVFGVTGYSQFRLRNSYTPSGTGDTNGNIGDISWDDNFVYIKTNSGWKRTALSTW